MRVGLAILAFLAMSTPLPYCQDFDAPGYTLAGDGWSNTAGTATAASGVDASPCLEVTDHSLVEAVQDFTYTGPAFCIEARIKTASDIQSTIGSIFIANGIGRASFSIQNYFGYVKLSHYDPNIDPGDGGPAFLFTPQSTFRMAANTVYTLRFWGNTSPLADESTTWPALANGNMFASIDGVALSFPQLADLPQFADDRDYSETHLRLGMHLAGTPTDGTNYVVANWQLGLDGVAYLDDLKIGADCECTGTIEVHKVTSPGGSAQSFDFTAAGGLTPTTFALIDGGVQTFPDLAVGDGYSIAETAVTGWSTSFAVSNGSPPDNIAVGGGETVVVTVTNTQGSAPVPPTEGNDCCASSGPGGGSPGGGGGGYPPGTLPPRVVPAGGAPPEYIACNAGGGLPAFAADPADLSDLATCTIPRVYLQWRLRDGSVLRFGQFDFTSYHGPVTARVKKWGPVRQVLADRFGSFQVNHFTIQLSDTDRRIRGLLTSAATKYIDGTEIEVLIEADGGPPLVLARAVVSDYSFNTDLSIDLTCTDPLGYKYSSVSLDRPIPRRTFRRELFPALPEESSGKPVPIGYGIYSDDYTWLLNPNRIPVGIIPIHYVGAPSSIPGLEGAPGDHAFAVFGHALSCTQSVFASNLGKDVDGVTDVSYGSVRMPSSLFGSEFFVPGMDLPKYHDLTGTDGITERFCFLTVKEGARVRDHLNGRVPITINALGIEDVGDGTGNTITSLTYQFLHFLCQWVLQDYRTGPWLPVPTFADGTPKVRTSSFQSVVAIQTARMGEPYNGAMYLGEHKSGRTWNTAWQVSGDMRHGVNHQGQSLVETLNDTGSTVALTTFADTDDVIADSFEVEPKPEEIANILTYEAGPEAATNRVAVVAKTIRNLTSIANHDEREAQALTYEATRHPPTADDVANRTLVRTADAPTEVRFALNLRGAALRLGQLIRIKHYQGIGPFGWTDRVLLVTGVQTMPDADQFACEVECEDVHDVLAAGADVFMIDEALIDEARIG